MNEELRDLRDHFETLIEDVQTDINILRDKIDTIEQYNKAAKIEIIQHLIKTAQGGHLQGENFNYDAIGLPELEEILKQLQESTNDNK